MIALLQKNMLPHTNLLPLGSTLPYSIALQKVSHNNEPIRGTAVNDPHSNQDTTPCSNKAVQTNFDAVLQTFLLQESNVINTWNELRLSNGYHSNYQWTRHVLACHRDLCLTCNSKTSPDMKPTSQLTEQETKMAYISITQSLADKECTESEKPNGLDNEKVNIQRKLESKELAFGGTVTKNAKGHQLNICVPENATVIVTNLIQSNQSEPKLFSVIKSDKGSIQTSDIVSSFLENTAQATPPQQVDPCLGDPPNDSSSQKVTAKVVCPSEQSNVSAHLANLVKNLAGMLADSFNKHSTKEGGVKDIQEISSPDIPKAIALSLKDMTCVKPVDESTMISSDININNDYVASLPAERPKNEDLPSGKINSTEIDTCENGSDIIPMSAPLVIEEPTSGDKDVVYMKIIPLAPEEKQVLDSSESHKVPVVQQNETISRRKSRKPEKSHIFMKPTFTVLNDT